MNFANPTTLRLGMSGTFGGESYQLVGRAVLGVGESSGHYYWHEFTLRSEAGKEAILVFEKTESGPQWRLFTLFTPRHPLTPWEARDKVVGDLVALDEEALSVCLTGASTVECVEGTVPEGVEVGDVATYFNLEQDNSLQVVSWSGDEIEFYQGINLPAAMVKEAFGLPAEARLLPLFQWVRALTALVIVSAVIFMLFFSWQQRHPAPRPLMQTLTAPLLVPGQSGTLLGHSYRVRRHDLLNVARVNGHLGQQEYELEGGTKSGLLIFGLKPGLKEGVLLTPFEPSVPLTPEQAATFSAGQGVNLDGHPMPISELFQATVVPAAPAPAGLENEEEPVFYGFLAEDSAHLLLVRWNATTLTCYHGRKVSQETVTAAFK